MAECPDGGYCHHDCIRVCFRTQVCSPLSGVFPGDVWPSAVLPSPVDLAVETLDQRGEKWDLYRCHDKDWIVLLGGNLGGPVTPDRNSRTVRGKTILGALEAAVASVPLPVVPRKPEPWAATLEVRKSGSKWGIYDPSTQRTMAGDMKTKTIAQTNLATWVTREAETLAAWEAEYGPIVASGTPEVDFRWADR